jgi:hypothetical protein
MRAGTGETELAFPVLRAEKRPATVSVLVWKWNEGRREAATWAFVRVRIDKVRLTARKAEKACARL